MKICVPTLAFFAFLYINPIRHLLSYYFELGYLSGLKGLGGVFLLLIATILYVNMIKSQKTRLQWLGFFLFLSMILISFTVILIFPDFKISIGKDAMYFNLNILYYYCVYFVVGFHFYCKKSIKMIFLFWLLMIINLLYHFDYDGMRISFRGFTENAKTGVYILMADSFAVWTLFLLANVTKRPIFSFFISLVSTFALFALNSRASLYAFIMILPLSLMLIKKSARYALIILGTFIILYPHQIVDQLETVNKRMFIVQRLETDRSLQLRLEMFEEGLFAIKNNWFFGDYLGQLKSEHLGSYMHNYLSLWRQFGLFPFTVFVALLLYSLFASWKSFYLLRKCKLIDPHSYFLIVGILFCTIEIIFARSYGYFYIWFFIGMSLNKKSNPSP